ncbi:cupin domain-containing protein [Mastigocladopsis repens]|uniref:cupin domain-containing protein n=1 Tax=Mastigocladopsis repens TaxID=221287 RepID=UPI000307BD2A|nr:cupin domain-containing protein [Mastigocladopsis repens]
MKLKQVFLVVLLVVMLGVGYWGISFAQTPAKQFTPEPTKVLNVKTSDIPKVSVLESEILAATMAPGEVSIWHTHGSPVFAYTISGEYIVDFQSGQPSITVPAGKAIMEPINVVVRARNPSSTEPATLVLFQMRKPGTAFLDPVSK